MTDPFPPPASTPPAPAGASPTAPSPAPAPAEPRWALPDSSVDQPTRTTGLLDLTSPDARVGSGDGPRSKAGGNGRAIGPVRLPVPLRPMTMLDKLDGSFAIIKARPSRIVAVAAVVIVPAHFLQAFLIRGNAGFGEMLQAIDTASTGSTASTADAGGDLVMSLLALTVSALAAMLLGGALTPFVTGWYAGEDPTVGQVLRIWIRRVPHLLGAFLILLPVKAIGALCYLPALFFTPVFIVVAPVIMAEAVGPFQALQRSWRLTIRRFGSVLATWLLASIVEVGVGQVLLLLVQGLAGSSESTWKWLVTGTGSSLIALLIGPFAAGVAILQYLDLRVRSEGLDIEMAAERAFPDVRTARP